MTFQIQNIHDDLIASFSPFPIDRFQGKRAGQAAGSPLAEKARPTIALAIGDTVADGEHLDLIDPRRCTKVDDVALMRLHQRFGDR